MKHSIAILILVAIATAPAKDKKAEERIAELEKKVAQLESDISAVDAGARAAFKKTGDVLTDVVANEEDLSTRMTKLERRNSLRSSLSRSGQVVVR